MGQQFHHNDVGIGKIIRLERNNVFEGYALLLEPLDEGNTQLIGGQDKLYVKQRWSIRWIDPDELPGDLPPDENITQKILKNRFTHRYILYSAKGTEKMDPYTTDHSSYEKESDFDLNDDFNGFF